MTDNNKGPWGSNNDNKTPWEKSGNQGGNGGGRRPPPEGPGIDEIFQKLNEQLGRAFVKKGGTGKGGIAVLIVLLLVLWGATGFYRVLPEEHGVIMTFGKWTTTKDKPGLGYHIPWPIQQVEKVNVTFERRIEVGFRDKAPRRNSRSAAGSVKKGTDIPGESLMLTGDENIVDIDFVVLWRINDAGKYLFEIRDPEATVKKVAESAMREIIGRTEIQSALTEGRAQVEAKTKELMQSMMNDYVSGIEINEVQLQKVDPPGQVVDAFDDVQRARADKERLRNQADAYRNDILPKARGEAEKVKQQAQAYEQEVIKNAEGDADRFLSVYKAYANNKDITVRRLYIETMQHVLKKSNKVIMDKKQGILPYLPLDKMQPQSRR